VFLFIINGVNVSENVSGSDSGASSTPFWSERVGNCEKVQALNYLRQQKVNNGRKQGKQNVQIFSAKVFLNSIVLFKSYSNGNSVFFKCNDYSIYRLLTTQHFKLSIGDGRRRGREAFVAGDNFLKHKQIRLRLLAQGVHPHPGPGSVRPDISFLTYNCRGLNNADKLRRLLSKLSKLVDQNYIIALQETHKIDDRLLKLYWKENFISNCCSSNKRGVALLFNNSYSVNQLYKDDLDRSVFVELESDKHKLIIGNVYFPNDHREALDFNESTYHKLLEFQYRSPEALTCLMGDINHCLSPNDSVNRSSTSAEKELAALTKNNNNVCNIVDSYREINKEGGFTWNRGNCHSRLDYIFIAEELISKIVDVKLDWCLEKSDHSAVICNLKVGNNIAKGPGIARLKVNLLDNQQSAEEIKSQIKEMIDQIPEDWNPHTKLEFVKVAIRTAFSNVGGSYNKERNLEIGEIEDQINRHNRLREREMINGNVNQSLISKINEANDELQGELERLRAKYSEDLAFKSGVKWYEEGEKSNRYFLGLMKAKARRKLIEEIRDEEATHGKQDRIMECITSFYKKL
jgi:exonuclease III